MDFVILLVLIKVGIALKTFPTKGNIVDKTGRILGYHNGMHQFTIGQRKGIKLLGALLCNC